MNLLEIFDLIGTGAFAISGALVAMRKRLDVFGVFIIGFVTAVGGGSLRDLLIDRHPLLWLEDMNYLIAITIGVIIAILFKSQLRKISRSLFLFDAIGLGIFTISGTQLGMAANLNPVISIALGTLSASFGGVIRDILCNEIPVIFRREIYATACIIGGALFLVLSHFKALETINYSVTIFAVISIRIVAAKWNLALPSIYKKAED